MPQEFLYERISRRLLAQIRADTYRAGDRVPSVRALSRLFGVSVNTVIQSYRQLELEGYLEARPQSGFFVRDQRQPERAPADRFPLLPVEVSLSERVLRCMELHARPDLIHLGIAVPAPEILPVERVLRSLRQVLREQPLESWNYSHPDGIAPLREQLARRSLTHEVPLEPADIIVTGGCMEALSHALGCVSRPGDAIAVEAPTYYGSLLLLEVHGRRVIEVPTDPVSGVCLEAVERLFAERQVSALLFSANAQNPLGFTMPLERKRALMGLAERYQVPLLENDVWGDTVFDTERALPVKAFDRQGLVIYCNSFSKSLAPGLRVGWAAPGRFLRRFRQLKQLSTITTAPAPQLMLARLLESGFLAQQARDLRQQLRTQLTATARLLAGSLPRGARLSEPSGGCVLWVELPPAVDPETLCQRAVAAGIHVFPGDIFSALGAPRNHLRISTGNPLTPPVVAAVQTVGQLACELCRQPASPPLANAAPC